MDKYGWRVGTGFLSTPLVLDVLAKENVEYAYKLLENEEMPGWLFMVKENSTTIWESWEGDSTPDAGIASLNHYSKGAVCEWLISGMCGLNVVGENKFVFEPKIGGKETYAKCEYQSIYGKVSCSWKKEGDKTTYEVILPPNTSAKLILPNEKKEIHTGSYTFKY